jgi:chromosome segregation ATPase
MSSEPHESNPGVEQDGAAEHPEEGVESPALTIALPDGCESVSDAIVTNREMLREPQDHGLATDEDIVHLSEAIEGLSGTVEEVSQQYEESQETVSELRDTVERQQEQIDELQSMVSSLADILGTEAEWDTFEDA